MANLQEQIRALADAHEQGIDTVAAGIQDLYKIVDHMSAQMRNADVLIATLKFLLIHKGIFTEVEMDNLQKKIVDLANKSLEDMTVDKTKPTAANMQGELQLIHEAAKKAAATPYDADAFIFGS